jgi:uncharacterized protein YjbI with pentapeptide repeats
MSDPMPSGEPQPTHEEREDLPPVQDLRWRMRIFLRRVSVRTLTALFGAVVLGLLLLSIVIFPRLLVPDLTGSELKDLKPPEVTAAKNNVDKARNDVRTTLVQTIGGALILLTASIAWAQVQTARRGQITDRFTKSVDQLGSTERQVCVGGVYALNQVADTPEYTRAVAEVLLAYLKSKSDPSRPGSQPAVLAPPEMDVPTPEIDKQAIIRILVQENLWNRAVAGRLDLSSINVAYAPLNGAALSRAKMAGAKLHYADLQNADLQATDMYRAEFDHANLDGADLSGADIRNASFASASFSASTKQRAKLMTVQAQDAKFPDARLNVARLSGDFNNAQFPGAHLNAAQLSGDFSDANFQAAFLIRAILRGADLTKANFSGADLSGADLSGANLSEATLVGLIITKDPVVDSRTKLRDIVTDNSTRVRLEELVAVAAKRDSPPTGDPLD